MQGRANSTVRHESLNPGKCIAQLSRLSIPYLYSAASLAPLFLGFAAFASTGARNFPV
jgi:hypothetical protein